MLVITLLASLLLSPYLDVTSLFNYAAGLAGFLFVIVTVLIFIFIYDNLRRERKTATSTS